MLGESSKGLNISGETLALMSKQEIEKLFEKDSAEKIFSEVFMMKQGKMKAEAGDIGLKLGNMEQTMLDSIFGPEDIIPETIHEALNKAGFKDTEDIIKSCDDKLKSDMVVNAKKKLNLTNDEVYTMLVFTYKAKLTADSPDKVLNQALLDRDTERLKTLRGFIFNLLSVLRKLKPIENNVTLYRGADGRWLRYDSSYFVKGKEFVFPSLMSTSTDEKVAQGFLDRDDSKVEDPTLYEVHGEFQGYPIIFADCRG